MDFDTFKDELAKGVQERLEALYDRKYSVETHTVEKMNETYEAITVKPEDSEIGVNIKIDKAYAEYNDGRSFDMIVRQVSSFAAESLDNRPGFDLNAIQDYSVMKTKLSMEVVSAERNAQLLETVPHKNMEDMAIVYRFVLDTVEAGRGSILVTNKMLDNYGITAEQLHNDAMEIAPEVRPAVIKGMSEVLADMMGAEQAEMLQYGFLFCLKTCMIIHELSEMMILEELGMTIGFVIWSFCAVLFFIVGVVVVYHRDCV